MKKITSQEMNLRIANIATFTVCLVLSHSLLSIVLWILHHFYHLKNESPAGQIVGKITMISIVFLPIITYIIALFSGVNRRFFIYLCKRDEKKISDKIANLQHERDTAKKNMTERITTQKESGYHIKQVSGVDGRPYVFGITIEDTLYKDAIPTVKINGIVVPIEIHNAQSVLCFASEAISTEEPSLNFSVGKNVFPITNPYLMAWENVEGIVWQNEGHSYQKKILLPKELFPNASEFVTYGFKMYIGNQLHGSFEGTYEPKIGKIVIPLGGGIYKRQCAGKKVFLRTVFGKGRKFCLPNPSILN